MQVANLGIAQDLAELFSLVTGIDGDRKSTQPTTGKKCEDPIGRIYAPDTYMGTSCSWADLIFA